MPFRTLLSVIEVNQDDRDIRSAIEFCREIDARLSILVIALVSHPAIANLNIVAEDVLLKERQNASAVLRMRVDEIGMLVDKSAISTEVIDVFPEGASTGSVTAKRAPWADLTIISPDLLDREILKGQALEGVLFEFGRLILIVPRGRKATFRPNCVLLACESRTNCTRAACESLDLMACAERVHVAVIDADAGTTTNGGPAADIAAYLSHHAVEVRLDRLVSAGNPMVDVLNQHATDISADLIVMGGYVESRMQKRAIGNVAKSMIDAQSVPILMTY
jgi:nucleotide-binding universal stress UspA family protein